MWNESTQQFWFGAMRPKQAYMSSHYLRWGGLEELGKYTDTNVPATTQKACIKCANPNVVTN